MTISVPNVIAVICDFDDTLGDDTTNLFLKEILRMDENDIDSFWNKEVKSWVAKGWVRAKPITIELTAEELEDIF